MNPTPLDWWDGFFRLFVAWQLVWGGVAFVAIWRDKALAAGNRTRLPERRLHGYESWGGWLGSLAAQRLFRHKTRKATYQRTFLRISLGWMLAWLLILGLRALLSFNS